MHSGRTFLFLSQVYIPDPASVGQHMADAASELARRGHRVIVFTANRGYDDPADRYSSREVIDGVEVRRFPFCSYGKRSIAVRLLGGASFVAQAALKGLFVRDLDTVVVSTSPPMASAAAVVISRLRKAAMKFWVMDLNPDQMIALGRITERSLPARAFDWLNRAALERATDVVVLDRFMAKRVNRKRDVGGKLTVLPPWPHENDHDPDPVRPEQNPFRDRHGLAGKFVVMYSGNHGPSNPITTLIEAAKRLRDDPRFVFMFIGGGVGKEAVEAADSPNIRSLPYQPLAELRYSLSAADVHVVAVGDDVVGIVHPCKVYGAMAVARPILLFGPGECHVSDLLDGEQIGWQVRHGDVDGAERVLRSLVDVAATELAPRGARAKQVITERLSKSILCGRFCDILEFGTTRESEPTPVRPRPRRRARELAGPAAR